MARRFDVLNAADAIFDGTHKLDSGVTVPVYNGYVAVLQTDGDVVPDDGSLRILGLFYEFMPMEEYPTTDDLQDYLTGEYCNVVTGRFMGLVSAEHFSEGTLPAIGDLIYNKGDGSGKLDHTTNGTTVLGKAVGTKSVLDETGTAATALVVQFSI